MVSEYPKEEQNPPTIPGARPDQQPPPRQRVPDDYDQRKDKGDPRSPKDPDERGGEQADA